MNNDVIIVIIAFLEFGKCVTELNAPQTSGSKSCKGSLHCLKRQDFWPLDHSSTRVATLLPSVTVII